MPYTCKTCARPLKTGGIVLPYESAEATGAILLCPQCYSFFGSCASCQHASVCALEAYTGPQPKVVMRTIHQGNATLQTQVLNPELVKELCLNCPCCDPGDEFTEPVCQRANNLCLNYEEIRLNP